MSTHRTMYTPNMIRLKEKYALLYLYNRKQEVVAKVRIDLNDVDRVGKYKWSKNNKGYAYNSSKGLLHRFIVEAKPGQDYDHKNNKPLDCRRKNLRPCTSQENNRNSSIRSDNTSGAKGVTWNKPLGKYVARIMVDKKNIHLGYFTILKDAALAYNVAAKRYFGDFAVINNIK